MKTRISRSVNCLVAGLAVGVSLLIAAPPEVQAQGTVTTRLSTLEQLATNAPYTLASNQPTQKINFALNKPAYDVINLNTNLTLLLTNVIAGRDTEIFLQSDGTARDVTVSTNGSGGLSLIWDFTPNTNGASSFTVTNRAWVRLRPRPSGVIHASYMWGR
jgi:hypothetical protein